MTTTLGHLADAQDAMDAVLKLPLTAVASWKVTRLAQEVMPLTANYFEKRLHLAQRHGTPDAAVSGLFNFADGKKALFDAEMSELRAVEVTITSALVSLKSLDGHPIAGSHLLALGSLLIDDTPETRD